MRAASARDCLSRYACSVVIFPVIAILTPKMRSAWEDSTRLMHTEVVEVSAMSKLPGVSLMVAIRRFPSRVGIQVTRVNRHFDKDKSPPACRRRVCQDWSILVAVWSNSRIGVLSGRLHRMELSSI